MESLLDVIILETNKEFTLVKKKEGIKGQNVFVTDQQRVAKNFSSNKTNSKIFYDVVLMSFKEKFNKFIEKNYKKGDTIYFCPRVELQEEGNMYLLHIIVGTDLKD